jgi:hypothetical protein
MLQKYQKTVKMANLFPYFWRIGCIKPLSSKCEYGPFSKYFQAMYSVFSHSQFQKGNFQRPRKAMIVGELPYLENWKNVMKSYI